MFLIQHTVFEVGLVLACLDFRFVRRSLAAVLVASFFQATATAEAPVLLGKATIAGNARDLSGKKGSFSTGVPRNQFGGFSAISATATPDEYLLLSDRGPDDGAHAYETRFHRVKLSTVTPDDVREGLSAGEASQLPVRLECELLGTTLLSSDGRPWVGLASVYAENSEYAGRFDPEGIRGLPGGNLIISDEYGPSLAVFSDSGALIKSLAVPEAFKISNPGLTKAEENATNSSGRQGNGGFEGVAISPDGRYLTAILQGPLLQDGAFDESGEDQGRFARIYQLDLQSGKSVQFAYPLESPKFGVSEILSLDDETFLVLERDSKAGKKSACKALFRINTADASDISKIESLAADALPASIQPVKKELYLDMLGEGYGLHESIPKKIEGVCWGPTLIDGTKTLVICSDNDFEPEQASQIFVFGIR